MRTVREAWTDERLDDLNGRIERGFDRVDADIRDLRSEMNSRFEAVDRRFDAIDNRFDAVDRRFESVNADVKSLNDRFDELHRTMFLGFASIVATLLATTLVNHL
jgi:predicted nuclease with TOPRIM domain